MARLPNSGTISITSACCNSLALFLRWGKPPHSLERNFHTIENSAVSGYRVLYFEISKDMSQNETCLLDYIFLRTSFTAAQGRMWSNTCPYWFLRGTITPQTFTMEVFFLCQRI